MCRIYKTGSCIRYILITLIPILLSSFPYHYPHSHSTILIPILLSSFPYHYPHSHSIILIPILLSSFPFHYRLDSTLGDFTEMQWTRGDISFIYNGENTQNSDTLSVVALDNNKKQYQNLSLSSGVCSFLSLSPSLPPLPYLSLSPLSLLSLSLPLSLSPSPLFIPLSLPSLPSLPLSLSLSLSLPSLPLSPICPFQTLMFTIGGCQCQYRRPLGLHDDQVRRAPPLPPSLTSLLPYLNLLLPLLSPSSPPLPLFPPYPNPGL